MLLEGGIGLLTETGELPFVVLILSKFDSLNSENQRNNKESSVQVA